MSYSGGGYSSGIQMSNIGDYRKVDELFTIAESSLFTTFLTIVIARLGNVGGLKLNSLFENYGLEAVVGITSLSTLVLQVARILYTNFYTNYGKPWSPIVFFAFALVVQAFHDVIFNFGILQTLAPGKNINSF